MAGEVAGFLYEILQTRVGLSKFHWTVVNEPAMRETKACVEYQLFFFTVEYETDEEPKRRKTLQQAFKWLRGKRPRIVAPVSKTKHFPLSFARETL